MNTSCDLFYDLIILIFILYRHRQKNTRDKYFITGILM